MRSLAIPALFAVVPALAGCPKTSDPGDSGMPPDGEPPGLEDTDGDGVCDISEESFGLDPLSPDTDADGYPDRVEGDLMSGATLPAEPDRATVFTLEEDVMARIVVPISFLVDGEGEDYTGAFEGVPPGDVFDTTADVYYESATALFANPEANVAFVEPEAAAFRGVVGSTELHFEIMLGFGFEMQRDCARASLFRYTVKRSDGRVVGLRRLVLFVTPPGGTPTTATWCPYSGPCI